MVIGYYIERPVVRFTGRNLIDALIEMNFIVRSDFIVVALSLSL